MTHNRLYYLLGKYYQKNYTEQERSELFEMLSRTENETAIKAWIDEAFSRNLPYAMGSPTEDEILQAILSVKPATQPVRRLWPVFLRYAAVIILLAGSVVFWYKASRTHNLPATENKMSLSAGNDIVAGGNKAVLILSDGHKIILDSTANGNLASQGGTKVVKSANGQIVYNPASTPDAEVMWNTMSTPTGGQYQVVLPDGTKVWLNASSSITFPTAFAGDKREVKVNGEVYLEVAQNKSKPFVVDVGGRQSVEVLGTSFNINSYENEGNIKTTLIDGSVAVSVIGGPQPKLSVILKPRQQAVVRYAADAGHDIVSPQHAGNIVVTDNTDINKALAWKNGLFNFNGSDLYSVMRQLERWYDINVEYQGSVREIMFYGEMYRNVNLSDVLEMLKEMGVQFKLQEKKLIVY